jgi:PAS domain-containing protein
MTGQASAAVLPLGLLELGEDGTVLYFNPEKKESPGGEPADLVGRNFFAAVPALADAAEFRERLRRFRRSHAPAESFTCDFPPEHGCARAKVLLARIHEQSQFGHADSILVHIKEAP